MSATGRIEANGFTLLEMLVVLAITALISALAYPAAERSLAEIRYRQAVDTVEQALAAARSRAIATGTMQRFVADTAQGGIRIDPAAGGIAFYPDGSARGGAVTVAGRRRTSRFVVISTTGEIRKLP